MLFPELEAGARVFLVIASWLGLFALVVHNNQWPDPWPIVVGLGGAALVWLLLIYGVSF
jgi:hypothetical protein